MEQAAATTPATDAGSSSLGHTPVSRGRERAVSTASVGSMGSAAGGPPRRTRSSRETAEPLAHALDATLSHLMDEKISNFGRAFKNMETRLNRQQSVLDSLERSIEEEEAVARAENEAISAKIQDIHGLIEQNVSVDELQELQGRIQDMEKYVEEEIELKIEQIGKMHDSLAAFTTLGVKVEQAKEDAQRRTAEAREQTRVVLEEEKARKQLELPGGQARERLMSSPRGGGRGAGARSPSGGTAGELAELLLSLSLGGYAAAFADAGHTTRATLLAMDRGALEALCLDVVDMRKTECAQLTAALGAG